MQISEIESCEQLLEAWDGGKILFTVEMGGLGPGYEQAIHVAAFEILRYMLTDPPDWDRLAKDTEDTPYELRYWTEYRDRLTKALFGEGMVCGKLGLSGAQFGAAANIASCFLKQGYQKAMEMAGHERHIQVSRGFQAIP